MLLFEWAMENDAEVICEIFLYFYLSFWPTVKVEILISSGPGYFYHAQFSKVDVLSREFYIKLTVVTVVLYPFIMVNSGAGG